MRLSCWSRRNKRSDSFFIQQSLYKCSRGRETGNYQISQAQGCIFTWWLLEGELGSAGLESILLFPHKILIWMPDKSPLTEWRAHSNRMYQLDWCLHHRLTLIYWALLCCCDASEGMYIQVYRLTSCAQMESYWISTWVIWCLQNLSKAWSPFKGKQVL